MAVTGIGGVFFRASDPAGLRAWYHQHFGLPTDYTPWQQAAGPTVFMPFKADTDYFPAERQYMLNFRVDGLDALLAKLRADGVEVTTNPAWDAPETGRFARIQDPEGNQIELWEPPAE
jgi:predicted enzyme related to lactoylglutathione lyase